MQGAANVRGWTRARVVRLVGWLGRLERAPAPSGREVGLFALVAVVLACAYLPHIIHGGFYNDSWSHLHDTKFARRPGFFGVVHQFGYVSFRPGQLIYWPLTYTVFGANSHLHLALGVLFAVGMSAALYLLMRTLGVPRIHATVVAALVLLQPVADAMFFWVGTTVSQFSIMLFLLGATVSVHALGAKGRRAIALHAAGLALYEVALLTYEIVAIPILLSIAMYVWRAPLRKSLRRWAVDAGVTVVTLVFITSQSFYERLPLSEQVTHAARLFGGGVALLTRVILPFGSLPRWLGPAVVLLVFAVAVFDWRRLAPGSGERRVLERLAAALAASALAAAVGWAIFIPSADFATLGEGQHNRVNALAAIGLSAFAYCFILLVATLVARRFPGRPQLKTAVAGVLLIALSVGYVQTTLGHSADWNRADDEQHAVLSAIDRSVGRPPPRSTVFTMNARPYVADGIPVFAATWDLSGALSVRWSDRTLNAYPQLPGSTYSCDARSIVMHNANDAYATQRGAFGRTFIVDVGRSTARRIQNAADCRAVARNPLAQRGGPAATRPLAHQ